MNIYNVIIMFIFFLEFNSNKKYICIEYRVFRFYRPICFWIFYPSEWFPWRNDGLKITKFHLNAINSNNAVEWRKLTSNVRKKNYMFFMVRFSIVFIHLWQGNMYIIVFLINYHQYSSTNYTSRFLDATHIFHVWFIFCSPLLPFLTDTDNVSYPI